MTLTNDSRVRALIGERPIFEEINFEAARALSDCLSDDCYFPSRLKIRRGRSWGHKSLRRAVNRLRDQLRRLSGPGSVLLILGMVIFLLAETRASAAVKELEELRSPSPSHLSSSDVASEASKAARSVAMKEAAMGSAVQAGARWRYAKILQEVVGPMEERLDELFDFEPLISRRGNLILVPPVVTEAGEGLRMGPPSTASGDNGSAGSRSAVGQSKSYQMIRSAYLSALAPHWRHYLMDLPDGPGGFHPSLLPEGSLETSQWRSWVDQGWELGVRHAERLFEQKSSQLARDYSGMLLFKRLVYLNLAVGPQAKENKIDLEILGREMIFDRKYFQLIEEGRFAEPKGRALPR